LAAGATRTGFVALSSIAAVSGLTSLAGAVIAWGLLPPNRAAAGIAVCAVASLAILPWAAARVAGIALPSGDDGPGWSGQRLERAEKQARVAVDVLHGTTMGGVVAAAAAAGSLGWHATSLELSFAVLILAVVALRMRATVHRASRAVMLASSLGGLAGTAVLQAFSGGMTGVLLGVLLAVAWCGWMALMLPSSYRPSPITARALDVAEAAALIAIVPLAGWLTGLFAVARHWS
jgi:hypothetical protein